MKAIIYVVLMMSLLWLPPLIGGNYTSGVYDWNWTRTVALICIVVLGSGSYLFAKRSDFFAMWWIAYILVFISSLLLAFSMLVSSAWVLVPSFSILYASVGIILVTALLPKRFKATALVFATGTASLVYSFGLFFFPP